MSEVEKNLDAALGASIDTNGDLNNTDQLDQPDVTHVNTNEYEVDTSDEEVIFLLTLYNLTF